MQQLLKYEFNAEPVKLQGMRQRVKTALASRNFNKATIDRLILAVNEAAMNVIQHAYQFDCKGHIWIEIKLKDDNLLFIVTDFADAVDQECVKSRDLEDLRPGGLGVHFINEIMDDVSFQEDCQHTGNVLIMRKKVDSSCLK